MEQPKSSGHAPVNGIEMYYEIHGKGEMPLVLIHGGGSTIESNFGNILPLLAKDFRIIAVELQAHGRTSDRFAPESFQQDADDVAALLKYLDIGKADFLGFSNGGSTVLRIAIAHPEITNKIVVASGACKRNGFMPGFFEFMPSATLSDMPAPLQDAFLKVTSDKDKLQIMFEKDRNRMVGFQDWPNEELKSIKAPAMIISADRDVIVPEHSVEMSRLIQHSQLVILPGTHSSYIGEACEALNETLVGITASLVTEFLKE